MGLTIAQRSGWCIVTRVLVHCLRCDHAAAPEALSAGACAHCGAALAAMPEIDISKLATLDERDAPAANRPEPRTADELIAPAIAPAPRSPDITATPPDASDPRFSPPPPPALEPRPPRSAPSTGNAFAPPAELGDAPLGVERSTRAIRIANQFEREIAAAARAPSPRLARPSPAPSASGVTAPPRSHAGLLVGILAILAVAAGIFFVVRRTPPPATPHAGISIRIIARSPTAITIDGHAAGKTPLTLQRARGTQPLTIAAPSFVKQIIPDHDQVIDVSLP
jgi:hypothetical protein